MAIEVDQEASDLMREIEDRFPSSKCSLEEYRSVLHSLRMDLNDRINELTQEIGDDGVE